MNQRNWGILHETVKAQITFSDLHPLDHIEEPAELVTDSVIWLYISTGISTCDILSYTRPFNKFEM